MSRLNLHTLRNLLLLLHKLIIVIIHLLIELLVMKLVLPLHHNPRNGTMRILNLRTQLQRLIHIGPILNDLPRL